MKNYESNDLNEQVALLERLPTAESIPLLQKMRRRQRDMIWSLLAKDTLYEVFVAAPRAMKIELLESIPTTTLTHLWAAAPKQLKQRLFTQLSASLCNQIEQSQIYPTDSVGALMDVDVITLQEGMRAGQSLQKIKRSGHKESRVFYVLDSHHHLKYYIDIADLALADSREIIDSHAHPIPVTLQPGMTQDDLMDLAGITDLKALPVTDEDNIFLGVVRSADLFIATREEATADIQQMVGVDKDERVLSSVSYSIRKRLPWLQINLLTAFLASFVVGLFESTLQQFTFLAVLMPIVSGQSGNTGAQALAVTMRGLALNEVTISHSVRIISKEMFVAMVNGIAVAFTAALGVYWWSKDAGLALIIIISMVISMIIAAIAGAAVPLVLERAGQDPAQASSIILTTITDCVGFSSFLGIATMLSFLL